MNITIETFDQFVSGGFDYNKTLGTHTTLHLISKNADIGGGKLTFEDIDVLAEYPFIDVVAVSGLRQDTFEYFIKKYGQQFKAIRFFKNKLVEDWSLLSTLPNLEYLYFFANQRITSLWDMSGNYSLKGVAIDDFSRLHNINGIEKAPSLKCFRIGDAIWSTTVIESFMPLEGTKIEYLSFSGKKIEDCDLSFLHSMTELKQFNFATNLFTTEQVAWIVANFPQISGFALRAKLDTEGYNEKTGKADVPASLIVGKRKPFLINKGNEEKIQRYVEKFNQLVDYYRGRKAP